ncbi:hypothetical protein [Streptomyces clavuligerus]|uniref:hypothetical protein n=1 Tax=Streptomyces clavuligerus TaxID=1901 RepID=UPI0001800419|nr:hypothetical protein [Streptomyces clavuligerus]EDY52230.1 hypothetical protein SSCG_05225 [Streptomyces clavuligerus]WDN56078.1 hypothetical protein LL058_29825 [Streptomyces clavuligerus]
MHHSDIETSLVRDFTTRLGVSQETARTAAGLLFTVSAALPPAQAQAELERVTNQALTAGEPWAVEFIGAQIAQRLPGYRSTYRRAVAAGEDPVAAIARDHGLSRDAATEAIVLVQNGLIA